jgi:signal peptidase II
MLDGKSIYVSYLLLILTISISIYLVWLIYNEENFKKKSALSFIAGGALGNILDRFNDGQVTDFLHLEILEFSFFVFNFADLFITVGAILIIYFEIIYKPKNE